MSKDAAPPLPWAGWPDEIGCNFAAGHLVQNLGPPLIGNDGRLHAETFMAAAGVLAGWGAHRSLLANPDALAGPGLGMHIVTLKDGREMLYGDAINNRLMTSDPEQAKLCVWNNLAGTAIGHGLSEADLPDPAALFRSVTERMGGPLEGMPSTPDDHRPAAPGRMLLDRVMPLALACLTGEISEITKRQGFAASETSYQAVTAWAAAKVLAQCCSVMAPGLALVIGMESAIYGSKLRAPYQPQA